jgi:hypothetical protein
LTLERKGGLGIAASALRLMTGLARETQSGLPEVYVASQTTFLFELKGATDAPHYTEFSLVTHA